MLTETKVTLPHFENYGPTGEWREPNIGEWYLTGYGDIIRCLRSTGGQAFHIFKKQLWRAEKGRNYFYITDEMKLYHCIEEGNVRDNLRWQSGNYFSTHDEGEDILHKIRATLKQGSLKDDPC